MTLTFDLFSGCSEAFFLTTPQRFWHRWNQMMRCFRCYSALFFVKTHLKVGSLRSHFSFKNCRHILYLWTGQDLLGLWNVYRMWFYGRPWKRCGLEGSICCCKISVNFSALMLPSQKWNELCRGPWSNPIPSQSLAAGTQIPVKTCNNQCPLFPKHLKESLKGSWWNPNRNTMGNTSLEQLLLSVDASDPGCGSVP